MKSMVLTYALIVGSLAGVAATFTTDAQAGWCEGIPPNKKVTCCLNHPKAPACR